MAIDYTLAKELLDAGFPQGGNGTWVMPPDKIVLRRDDRVYVPTLSELIAAVGHDFCRLERDVEATEEDVYWCAYAHSLDIGTFGDTPEEAVARLLLALQKNV